MDLQRTIRDSRPLLLRQRIIEAVLKAQRQEGGPVSSQRVRASSAEPLLRHARALTELAWQISRLGPDELGRRLHAAGTDRKGAALWWVQEPLGRP